MRNRSLTSTLALAAAIVVAGVLAPATALAAPSSVRLQTLLGVSCIVGTKPTTGPITVKLLRANGTIRDTRTGSGGSTDWIVCFDKLPVAGNKVRMRTADPAESDGIVSRTVSIPDLTAVANRVTNVVSGHAPAGVQVSIEYRECHPRECDVELNVAAQANGSGRYHKNLSGSADIDGSDRVAVLYENTHGDQFFRTTMAPYMELRRPNKVEVLCTPKGTTTVKLRKADGTLRASKAFTAATACGFGTGSFKKNGNAVNPNPGNLIKADFASDAALVWPVLSVDGAGTTLSGRCLKNSQYEVIMVRSGGGMREDGVTDANGDFSTDLGAPAFQSGDTLELTCETERGDQVRLDRTL